MVNKSLLLLPIILTLLLYHTAHTNTYRSLLTSLHSSLQCSTTTIPDGLQNLPLNCELKFFNCSLFLFLVVNGGAWSMKMNYQITHVDKLVYFMNLTRVREQ